VAKIFALAKIFAVVSLRHVEVWRIKEAEFWKGKAPSQENF